MNPTARAALYDKVHAARRENDEQQRGEEEDKKVARQDQVGGEGNEQGDEEACDEQNEKTKELLSTANVNEDSDEQVNDQMIGEKEGNGETDSSEEHNTKMKEPFDTASNEDEKVQEIAQAHASFAATSVRRGDKQTSPAVARMPMEDVSESSVSFVMGVVRERSLQEHDDTDLRKKGLGMRRSSATNASSEFLIPAQLQAQAQSGVLSPKPARIQRDSSVGAHRVQPTSTASSAEVDLEAAAPPALIGGQPLVADEAIPGAHDCSNGSSTFLTIETHEGTQSTFTVDAASGDFAASVRDLFAAASDIQFLEATLVEEEEDAAAPRRSTTRRSLGGSMRMSSAALLVHATPLKDGFSRCWFPDCCSPKSKRILGTLLCLLLILAVLGLGLGLGLVSRRSNDDSLPTLEQIRKRGVLRCGVGSYSPALHFLDQNGEESGFDVALCRAIAAAVLGDDTKVEVTTYLMKGRFMGLFNKEVDLLAAGTTHTMEREVNEATTQTGFSFSTPYLYEGLQLAGDPQSVGCIEDNFKNTQQCSLIKVCVIDGTSHYAVLSAKLPGRQLHVMDTHESMVEAFVNRACLVIAHEGRQLQESTVRDLGYRGGYSLGNQILSKEPLSLVTRNNDPQWSKFVNSVLHSLFLAEQHGISKASADAFPLSSAFGEDYQHMFQNAIASGGSYAELYEEFLEPVIPRKSVNQLNVNPPSQSGLLYSFPLGSPEMYGKAAVGGYMEQLQMQRTLKCGIILDRPGFAELPTSGYSYKGVEVDLCRALSAVLFSGFSTEFELVPVGSQEEGYDALEEGLVDVFLGASWNFNSYTRKHPISFSPPYFYNISATEGNLCLATSGRHPYWSSFVYWVVMGLIQAEENGVTMDDSNNMPSVGLFGPGYQRMFRDSVLTVGSFGQMYNQSLQDVYPRQGRNLLNNGANPGPQHYAIPGLL